MFYFSSSAPTGGGPIPNSGKKSIVELIKDLNDLKQQGIISEEEFATAKQKVING